MEQKMDKKTIIITCVIVGVLFIAAGVWSAFSGRVKMNPPGTIGNTAGNLNNSGLFCEYNEKVYFANPRDNGTLYCMNANETEQRKLNDLQVCNILAGGSYLYYFQLHAADLSDFGGAISTHAFNRCSLNGDKSETITKDVVVTGQLVDNYLYLLAAGEEHPIFYKIKIDRTDEVHLADYIINPACAAGDGSIYYNGTVGDHYLYRLDTATDVSNTVWTGNLWYPVLEGDYIYFLDVPENYRLCRYSMSQQVVEMLTNERVDCFNVGSGYIYYQKNSKTQPQLKCMRTDGSDAFVLAEGNYTKINMTSRYVYFQQFGADNSLFHSPLGSDWFESF